MKIFKQIISTTLLLAIIVLLAACVGKPQSKIKISALKGPTGIGMVKLLQNDQSNYEITLASAPDEISAAILKGEPDIAAVPVNLAATLYQKTQGQYVVCGINTLGVLYIIDTTQQIQSVSDLKGKTIYATGQGSTPEYILRYVLSKNGINPDEDVTIEFKAEHAELATLVSSGAAQIALLPEPNVTTTLANAENARIALDMTEEWNKVSDDGSAVVQGCIVAKKDFLKENHSAYQTFIKDYKESVDFVNNHTKDAAQLVEDFGIVAKAAVAQKAIPNCNITLITGAEMKEKLTPFLNVLYTYNNKSVGGQLPDENFYYLEQ